MVKFIRKLNFWIIFGTLLSYSAAFVSPDQISLLLFIGLAYPWFLLANFIFIMIWAASKTRYWWYSALVILVGWPYLSATIGMNFFSGKTPKSRTEKIDKSLNLRVLSWNISDCGLANFKNKVAGFQQLNRFLENQDADIICLQETQDFPLISKSLPALTAFPFELHDADNMIRIFSRYALKEVEPFDFAPRSENGCLIADVALGEKTLRIFNLHLQSNQVSDLTDDLAQGKPLKELQKRETWKDIFLVLNNIRRNSRIRARQAERVIDKIAASANTPTLVCGDFNDIPTSYTYKVMTENMQDAFKLKGKGFGTTYSGKIPALRIDHVLGNQKLRFKFFEIQETNFSDHYPSLTIFQLED
jgi:endonuclease/exonuclease/phosphatase family metal-dependent hydrolase